MDTKGCDKDIYCGKCCDEITTLRARVEELEKELADARSGLRYILDTHGRLYGVGWDRILPGIGDDEGFSQIGIT